MTLYFATLYIPLIGLLITPFLVGALDRVVLGLLVLSISVLLGIKTAGHDYSSYIEYFDVIQKAASLEETLSVAKDPLLYFIVKALLPFSDSSQLIFFAIAITSLSAIAISLPNKLKHKSFFFCIYILLFGAGLNYEAIRAGLGLAFYYLFIKFINRRGSAVFSILSICSHISLAIPIIASYSRFSKIIARHPFGAALMFLVSSNLIPILLILDKRALWYVNLEGKGASLVAIIILIQFFCYLWATRKMYSESSSRLALISSALVTLFLSAIFSVYSGIIATRLYELGGGIFYLLIINDYADTRMIAASLYRRIALWGVIYAFILVEAYVWYVRFIIGYES
jgi:hypothetical protein